METMETLTLNLNSSCEGSPEKQREDEPICIFVSTHIPKGGHKNPADFDFSTMSQYTSIEYPNSEGGHRCKWYVLQSTEDTEDQGKEEEEGECPISIEIKKQFFPGTKRNFGVKSPIFLNQKTRAKRAKKAKMGKRANYRFKELLGLPSSLPYNVNAWNFKIVAFKSRIFLNQGTVGYFGGFRQLKDFYCLDTLSPEQGWKKASSDAPLLMAVAYSDKIYGLGKDINEYPFIWVLDPASYNCNWRELSKAPSSLEKIGHVVTVGVLDLGRKILFYSNDSQQLFYYNIERNSWSILAEDFGCWHGRLTVALGCVFCFGGFLGGYDLCAYDLNTLSWLPIEGLFWDGDIMPSNDPNHPQVYSADLLLVNHNKLVLFWTQDGGTALHCSKFFIHKTPNCIRATPCFCLTAHIHSLMGIHICVPLNDRCFGLHDVDYYEEEEGRRDLMLEGAEEVQVQESDSCFDLPDLESDSYS